MGTVHLLNGRLKVIQQGESEVTSYYGHEPNQTANNIFPAIPAALEFKCGDCFKKAFLYKEGVGFLVDLINGVVSPDQDNVPIIVEVYSEGRLVEKQFMQFIEVSLDSFCTGEFEVVRLDPLGPEHVGMSDIALELGCGKVCKKVLNIQDTFPNNEAMCHRKKKDKVVDDIVSVFPPFGELLLVKAFTAGKLFEKQGVGQLFTLQSLICSREENVIQIDHIHQDKKKDCCKC